MIYVYYDNSKGKYIKGEWKAPVVFQCESQSVIDADKLYKEATGKNVCKQCHIGCKMNKKSS